MITIVLPTYNEKDNLPVLVKKILSLKLDVELLIVDDNSPDGTGDVADKLAKKHGNIKVCHRCGERGLGSAIKFGFKIGINRLRSDFVGVMDTDLSHDPSILPDIFRQIKGGADFVIGSRYVEDGGIGDWPFIRRLASKIATFVLKPLTNVKDPLSGFFFVKKGVIKNMEINPESCKICLDIIIRGSHRKVVEVPYIFINRKIGRTKILTPKEVMKYLRYIVYLYTYKIRHRKLR